MLLCCTGEAKSRVTHCFKKSDRVRLHTYSLFQRRKNSSCGSRAEPPFSNEGLDRKPSDVNGLWIRCKQRVFLRAHLCKLMLGRLTPGLAASYVSVSTLLLSIKGPVSAF
ncbi:hypothetical protein KIL84_016163 [Mauremys mutica]|uniref:Uncharacterized protein n=1 Tax=Mauremys mutica TaxID=74926 RepID=A0A9D3WU04_9SAUR|nr:hypothetical protein KIL84_016163 [Mauremys mutica]